MAVGIIKIIIFALIFLLGFLIGWYIEDAKSPMAGSIHIDETEEKIQWVIRLYSNFSPEKISEKKSVKFSIVDGRRKS